MIRPAEQYKQKTVCQLLHSLDVGGAEILAVQLARHLNHEFRIVFACLDQVGSLGRSLQDEGVPVYLLDRRPGIDLGCGLRLARILRDNGVDLIHAHQYTPFFQSMLARLRNWNVPILFTEHGRTFPDYARTKRIVFNRTLLRKRDRVVGVGEAVRQALIRNEGFAPNRVDVVYNGVDLSHFATLSAQSRIDMRRSLGIAADESVLIQVARLNLLKDHSTALRTVERLKKGGCPVRLLLVGGGEERNKLEEETRERSIDDCVLFLGTRSDVAELLAAADILLLTSISEGIPLTVIEGMGAGLPVVSTDVGGVSEVVAEGKTGFLVLSGDDALLAERIRQLLNNEQLRADMGNAGRQLANERFASQRMYDEYSRIYKEMLGVA